MGLRTQKRKKKNKKKWRGFWRGEEDDGDSGWELLPFGGLEAVNLMEPGFSVYSRDTGS